MSNRQNVRAGEGYVHLLCVMQTNSFLFRGSYHSIHSHRFNVVTLSPSLTPSSWQPCILRGGAPSKSPFIVSPSPSQANERPSIPQHRRMPAPLMHRQTRTTAACPGVLLEAPAQLTPPDYPVGAGGDCRRTLADHSRVHTFSLPRHRPDRLSPQIAVPSHESFPCLLPESLKDA